MPAVGTLTQQSAKQGRGRPPTTGEYVGLVKPKSAFCNAQKKELDLLAEAETNRALRKASEVSADSLKAQVEKSLKVIKEVFLKSKKFKGMFVGALKLAADQISKTVAELTVCGDRLPCYVLYLTYFVFCFPIEFCFSDVKVKTEYEYIFSTFFFLYLELVYLYEYAFCFRKLVTPTKLKFNW